MKVQLVEEFLKEYRKNKYNLLQVSGDNFEVNEVIREIKKEFTKDKIEIFFKDDVENALYNLSMKTLFGGKLIIIYDVDTFPKSQVNKIKNCVKNPLLLKPNIVILTYTNKRNIPNVEGNLIGTFNPVYDSDIPSWILKYIRSLGYSITEEAINFLHFSFGTNREELRKQIGQIIERSKEGDTALTIEDVKKIGFYRDDTVFKITNSIIEGKYRTALQYLMSCSDKNAIFYFVNRDLRNLLVIRATLDLKENINKLGSKGRLNLHSYFMYNLYKPAALRLSFKELEKQFENIMESEYRIKNGWDEFNVNLNFISQLEVGGQ